MAVKIALPKGRLLRRTAAILQKAGWDIDDYTSRTSYYHPKSGKYPDLVIRVFNEKDIPIQIALGNYDLGICCRDWLEELLAKYPTSDILTVRNLGFGEGALYTASVAPLRELRGNGTGVRIASEYPNLAERYALRRRLSRFSVFPVWGAAEAYPPENADVALLAAGGRDLAATTGGVRWLVETQRDDGTWDEPQFTGTGFPGDFYINYHLYRLVFPLTALGRWCAATSAPGTVGGAR